MNSFSIKRDGVCGIANYIRRVRPRPPPPETAGYPQREDKTRAEVDRPAHPSLTLRSSRITISVRKPIAQNTVVVVKLTTTLRHFPLQPDELTFGETLSRTQPKPEPRPALVKVLSKGQTKHKPKALP